MLSLRRWLGAYKFRFGLFATKAKLALQSSWGRRRLTLRGTVVVSLTTHGSRLEHCHLAIESIGRGEARPGRIILWVSESDAQRKLPRSLRRQVRRGLEILIARDGLGPHTKYYPSLAVISDGAGPLVTADDDVLYPRYWLRQLEERHREVDDAVFCYRARVMRFDSPSSLTAYAMWPYASAANTSEGPLFITGVSGVLYPRKMIDALARRGEDFMAKCPTADDIWLSHTAHMSGLRIRLVDGRSMDFPTLDIAQATGLKHSNLAHGNDRQLADTYSDIDIRKLFDMQAVASSANVYQGDSS